MASLYQISQEYQEALDTAFVVDEETGEVIFQEQILEKLDVEFKDKVDNIVSYIKDLSILSDGIKAEKRALDERLKANDTKIDNLKKYITFALQMRNLNKYETPRNKLSFRSSKSVEVIDESFIDNQYWKVEEVKKLDKKTILDDLKNGVEVKGCCLVEKNNLQIR